MPDPTTLDRTARDARCAHLAAALARITETTRHRAGQPAVLHEQLLADLDAIGRTAAAALTRKGVALRPEYEVLWHPDGDDNMIRLSENMIGSLARARRVGAERVGSYGTSHYTVQRCIHVTYDDGWTVISPWEKVDERGLVFACGTCGEQVFRAYSFDGVAVWFVDAEPVPDGDLVLIPSDDDGGQPTAVYGEEPTPGRRRYRRHRESCTPEKPVVPGLILAEVKPSIPPNPPFTFITIRHPDGTTIRIDVPAKVRKPDGTMSDHGPDRLRVPLAAAGYRVIERSFTPPGRDVYAWRLEPITADETATPGTEA